MGKSYNSFDMVFTATIGVLQWHSITREYYEQEVWGVGQKATLPKWRSS